MITNNQIKLINSLAKKKHRDANQLFIAEGDKLVYDLCVNNHPIEHIYATSEWIHSHSISSSIPISETNNQYLKKVTQLKTAPQVIALCKIKEDTTDKIDLSKELVIALDNIQDPGNLGTIIRLADWFGIKHIICSNETVDVYNPKVVQATMGAIARVNTNYTVLTKFLEDIKEDIPVYGTFLNGDNIYQSKLSTNGIIVMGNEGQGISSEIAQLVNKRLLIPNFSDTQNTSESLNVSMATGITLSEFKRNLSH
ncbi:RNA methyltransferase [Saccharicrinis aurantiacus]|uniref:RNA methyltransferase n=1 Tax=Saccharicrinis aurantiacus TaxID=1849719 RepID=UPI00094FEAA8|nr:RNA methyltransferase [Saccharicrinis aurantiacus]